MKTIRSSVFSVLAAALMCLSLDASALTVGRLKGSALLGQSLEVVANLELAQDEDASDVCAQAIVAYGDVLQPAGQTTVKLVPNPQSQTVLAHIASAGFVNEPVVTIELKVGCAQKTTRRFVLLSEIAGENVSTGQGKLEASLAAGALQRTPPVTGVMPVVPAHPTTVETSNSQPSGKIPKTAHRATAYGSNVGLRITRSAPSALPAQAVEELQRRIDAVADKQAAKPSPQESAGRGEAIDMMQENLKVLQAVTLKNQKSILVVFNAIDKSEAQRLAPSLIYSMFGLVVLAVVSLVYLFFRSEPGPTSSNPWWGTNAGASTAKPASALAGKSKANELTLPINPPNTKAASAGVDIEVGESGYKELSTVAVPKGQSKSALELKRSDKRDFTHSGSATLRAINTKEMFDVRQQADFFMALGQHDEAIKVLEESNSESEESNPLVLLDLLKILHTLSRRADFDRYRAEFNLLFTGIVPTYESFLNEGNSLESYPDILRQIVKLWPSDEAMDFIEQCMVRAPEDEPTEGFDLEAFRELLILHGILRRIDNVEMDSGLMPFSANRTMSGTLSAQDLESGLDSVVLGSSDIATLAVPPQHTEGAANLPELDLDLTNNSTSNLIDFDVNEISGFDKPAV